MTFEVGLILIRLRTSFRRVNLFEGGTKDLGNLSWRESREDKGKCWGLRPQYVVTSPLESLQDSPGPGFLCKLVYAPQTSSQTKVS